MKTTFAENSWNQEELTYAYSYRFEETPVFLQKADCIENTKNEGAVYGYDNISLLTKEKVRSRHKIDRSVCIRRSWCTFTCHCGSGINR